MRFSNTRNGIAKILKIARGAASTVSFAATSNAKWTLDALKIAPPASRGIRFSREADLSGVSAGNKGDPVDNPLFSYFESHTEGPGIWKWIHYFDIYHRHFSKFVGRKVHVLEVGVYSGGSLKMWKEYFGDDCHVYGVDIEPACRAYATDGIQIYIGDQGDRSFWARLKENVPTVDILIDDGSHRFEQQIVTLEEMLPHLSAGGVYLCEDLFYASGPGYFPSYVAGLASSLNIAQTTEKGLAPSDFSAVIDSIHLYPHVVVIEKRDRRLRELIAPKHGTQWEPFL